MLAIAWNMAVSIAALCWLGYVGVNETQIKAANEHLFGHYGLTIVFMLKHLQGEMTQNVQGDLLFFNACFYSIVAVAGKIFEIVLNLQQILKTNFQCFNSFVCFACLHHNNCGLFLSRKWSMDFKDFCDDYDCNLLWSSCSVCVDERCEFKKTLKY